MALREWVDDDADEEYLSAMGVSPGGGVAGMGGCSSSLRPCSRGISEDFLGDSGSRPIPRRKGDDGSSVSSTGGASWVTGGVAARGEISEVSDEALGDCRYGPEITGREPTRGDAERLNSSVNDGFFMRLGDDTGDAGVQDRGGSCSME